MMRALLVVDVQNGLMKRKLFNKDEFLRVIIGAIERYRQLGQPIAFIQHNNSFLVKDTADWEISDSLAVDEDDIVVQKKHGNAFEKTELKQRLASRMVDSVVICGLVSHGCVRATCLGAKLENMRAELLKGGHSCWSSDAKEKIAKVERELGELGIDTISAEEC
jgi:nicotinamidase-related amidase